MMDTNHTIPTSLPEFDHARVIELPEGFFWEDKRSGERYGPFATLLDVVADIEAQNVTDYEPGETLAEAESEIGISEWVDPDTGEPAPEWATRTEDH